MSVAPSRKRTGEGPTRPPNKGATVLVKGLKGRPDLNEHTAIVLDDVSDTGRIAVQMCNTGEKCALKPDNLVKVQEMCIQGLTEKPDLNGQVATLTEEEDVDGRALVMLPNGDKMRVHRNNLAKPADNWFSKVGQGIAAVGGGIASAFGMSNREEMSNGPADHRVLLLGATGSGKTSFLNLLCNFNHVHESGLADITRFMAYNDLKKENSANLMESQTNDASVYRTKFMRLLVEVVDTPGFGDTGGTSKDTEHQKRIVETLSKVETLSCIAVVVSGADSRMNCFLEHVLLSVSSIMPAKRLPSVYVIYTHVDSLLKLTFSHEELEKKMNIKDLPFIVIDNPYSLLENAKQLSGKVPDEEIANELKAAFEKTRKELAKFKTFLESSKPSPTADFKKLHDKKCEIERAILNLLQDLKTLSSEEKNLRNMEADVLAGKNAAKIFGNYSSQQTVEKWVCTPTARHNTLCTYPECYTNCHLNCNLNFTHDKEIIKQCAAMNFGASEDCGKCNHHYEKHYHNSGKWEKTSETVNHVDDAMKSKFQNANNEATQKQLLVDGIKTSKDANQKKVDQLKQKLLLTITEFESLGSARSYKKLLASQINLLDTHIQAKEGESGWEKMVETMRSSKADLEKMLVAIAEAEKIENDPVFARKWACTIMDLGDNPSPDQVSTAYHKKSLEFHPDKRGGDKELFQKLNKAKGILEK